MSIPTLKCIPQASTNQAKAFRRLLEDREYAELSSNALELGLPVRFRRAGQLMRRAIEAIVSRPLFKPVFNLGVRYVTVATAVPLPDSGVVQVLVKSEYLPPAIPLAQAMADAAARWKDADSEFIPFPGWEDIERASE